MDSFCRANRGAFAAQFALVEIYISQVIFNGYSIESTYFCALSASNTGHRAILPGRPAFFLIDTADINPAVLLALRP
jgi:hypothetical protein